MSLKIHSYIDRLINLNDTTNNIFKKPRWTCKNKKCLYTESEKTKKSIASNKFESALKKMHADFKKFQINFPDPVAYEKLGVLIGLIQYHKKKYTESHSKAYLFVSRMLFGHVDKLASNLTNCLEGLRVKCQTPDLITAAAPAPAALETLETRVKSNRLKFYQLFADKIKIPKETPIDLPQVEISSKGVNIRIPRQLANDFNTWMERQLENQGIQFTQKNIVMQCDGTRYVKEFTLSLEEAQKWIENIPSQGLNNLTTLIQRPSFNLSHFETYQGSLRPHIENTISMNLAYLDPKLHARLACIKSHPQPQNEFPVPCVEFDDLGMHILIPETEEYLKELIKKTFGLKEEPITETRFKRSYSYKLFVPRDEINHFLKQLGLDQLPNGEKSYVQHLIETKRYHPYQPVNTSDTLESIQQSLTHLVYNEKQAEPYVSFHPKGWISLKIPKKQEAYVKSLSNFLNIEPLTIYQKFNNKTYSHEFIVHKDMLPQFLKKLKLENTPEGISYASCIQEMTNQQYLGTSTDSQSLTRLYAEKENNALDLPRTISRILSSLEPNLKVFLNDFGPQDYPEQINANMVLVSYNRERIEIQVPASLHSSFIPISPTKHLPFGQYLSHIFGLEGHLERSENGQENYHINIPTERTKSFLEKDLSLRILPPHYQKCEKVTQEIQEESMRLFSIRNEPAPTTKVGIPTLNIVTFYNLFQFEQNRHNPHGTVANLKIRNPTLPKPQNVPTISDRRYLNIVRKMLNNSPNIETYLTVFESTLRSIQHNEYGASIRQYLDLIMHEILNNKKISLDRKRNTLIEIGKSCSATCMGGKLGKIREAYQQLVCPEFKDVSTASLLSKVENFKKELLVQFFRTNPQSVHVVAQAQKDWGEDIGLNPNEESIHHSGWKPMQREKGIFEQRCRVFLLPGVYNLILADRDTEGAIVNIGSYQMKLRQILNQQGLSPDEIDSEIERLFPQDNVNGRYRISITEEAVKLLLINIGVLFE